MGVDRTLAGAFNGQVSYQSPPAINDSFTNGFFLQAGIYSITFEGAVATNAGSIDWYLDDVKVISAQSWNGGSYAAAQKLVTGIVVKTSGYHVLRGVQITASPNDYFFLSQIDFAPQYD